jgi:ammonium transporter, Amt family
VFLDITSGPTWLSPGDTAWQLTSATLVGIMSVPGLAILYAGVMKRKWAVNSSLMVLYGFGATLVVWTLFAYSMSFGKPVGVGPGFVGIPWPILDATQLEGQASIPLLNGLIPVLKFPQSALIYFQFVFAAITVIILGGAVLGRMSFKAWMLFVPLWITLVYSVGAFMLWAGGWLAQLGAVDYSGGYVIHVAAGTSGFVAAAVLGPRLLKDRQDNSPSNLIMAIAGGGLLWLGWSGFNGGDPYFANADAAAAVLNTHLCTAAAMLAWMFLDVFVGGKAKVTGMINGMIVGLVAITPAAGFVNGYAAIAIGVVASVGVWLMMTVVGPRTILSKVDDTLGVVYTHGMAGLAGGLLTGLLADPAMIVYTATGKSTPFSVTGLVYGNPRQFFVQLLAVVVIILYDAIATFIVLKVVGLVVPLRMPESELEVGDQAVHGDVAFDLLPVPSEA